jgi:TolA-binding protein
MNDPVRLLEVGASEFEAELLRAGRSDAVPAHSRKQILAGIGIGGLLTASTVAVGVRAAAKGWFMTAGVGTVTAIAVWAGVHAFSTPTAAPLPVTAHRTPAAEPAAPTGPAAPVVAIPSPEPEPVPTPAVPTKVASHAVSTVDASLTAELGALEQARAALLRHDNTRALELLDDYSHRFPKHRLGSEATVLRIEALAASGDRDGAARVGRDFLQSHPNGPYAQRVRSVIGDGSPNTRTQ